MTDKDKLTEEQLKQTLGGIKVGQGKNSDEVTSLLKQAGDRAWVLFGSGELWNLINQAENQSSDSLRKKYIQDALKQLDLVKIVLEQADYEFIYNKLNECLEKMN